MTDAPHEHQIKELMELLKAAQAEGRCSDREYRFAQLAHAFAKRVHKTRDALVEAVRAVGDVAGLASFENEEEATQIADRMRKLAVDLLTAETEPVVPVAIEQTFGKRF